MLFRKDGEKTGHTHPFFPAAQLHNASLLKAPPHSGEGGLMTSNTAAAIQERKQPEPRSAFLEVFEKEQDNGSSSFVRYIADQHEPSTERNRQRRESVFTTPFTICIERARYFTESYKETDSHRDLEVRPESNRILRTYYR